MICWLHVLFCSVWNLVISLHWPIMDHLSHQLKVFSHWNPKVRSTLTHPGPVAHIPYTVSPSRALQHSSPDNPKPRSFTSGSGASEFQAAQYVGHSEHINAVRASEAAHGDFSVLLDFGACTFQMLWVVYWWFSVGLFCDNCLWKVLLPVSFPLRNLGAFAANRKPIWKTEHQNWSLQTIHLTI